MPGKRAAAERGACDAGLAARLTLALDIAFPTLRRSLRKTLAVVCTGLLACVLMSAAPTLTQVQRITGCPSRRLLRQPLHACRL